MGRFSRLNRTECYCLAHAIWMYRVHLMEDARYGKELESWKRSMLKQMERLEEEARADGQKKNGVRGLPKRG